MAGIGTKPRDIMKPLAQANYNEAPAPEAAEIPAALAPTPVAEEMPIENPAAGGMELTPEEIAALDEMYGAQDNVGLTPEEIQQLDELYDVKTAKEPSSEDERSLEENIAQLPTRAKASFARTDKELKAVLEERYGAKNVRRKGDEFEIRENGKWMAFDEPGFGMGDIADFSRDVLEGAVSVPSRIAGGVAGFLSPVPGGAAVGQALAGGAGAAAGTALGDVVAQDVLGIPRDPGRDRMAELGTSAAFGAVFAPLGNWIGSKMAARQAAKTAVSTSDQAIAQGAKDLEEASQKMVEAGLMKPVGPEGKILLPDELAYDPNQLRLKNEILEKTPYKDFIVDRVNMINDGMNKLFGKAGNLEAAKTGKELVLSMDDVLESEGKLIGNYREALAKKAGDKALKAENYKRTVDEMAQSLGYSREAGKLNPPTVEDLLANQIVTSEAEAKGLLAFMNKELDNAYSKNGEYTAKELSGKLAQLTKQTQMAFKNKNTSYGVRDTYLKLKNALRDDELNAMEGFLQSAEFNAVKGKYGALKDATDTLGNLIKNDDISATALTRGIFTKGKQGLSNLRAVRTLLETQNPQAYRDFVGQYLGDVIQRNTDETAQRATKVNYAKIKKEFDNLGPEMLDEMFGPEGTKQAQEFFKLASIMDKGDVGFMADPNNVGIFKRMAVLSSGGWLAGQVSAAAALLADLGKDKAAAKFLSNEANQEILLKGLPKAEQAKLRPLFRQIVDRAASAAGKATVMGAKATRNQLRQEAIKANAEARSQGM